MQISLNIVPARETISESFMQEILYITWLLILSQLSPGPDVTYVFRASLSRGFRAGAAAGAGISTGFILHTVLVCSFGAAVNEWDGLPYIVWAAGAWLLYMAWKIFPKNRNDGTDHMFEGATQKPMRKIYCDAFLCNMLNPKATLFLAGLCVPVLGTHNEPWYPWALGAAMVFGGYFGWCLWAALLQFPPLHRCYIRHVRFIDAFFSLALAFFAVSLCFSMSSGS